MLRLLKSFAANFVSLLLSLVLAVFIWGIAVRDSDPDDNMQLDLPVQVIGRPAEHAVTGIPDTVELGVQGPASVVNQLDRDDFVAELDLTDVRPGESTLPITVRFQEETLELVWQVPQQVSLQVERIVTKEVPVRLELEGGVARGYVVGEPFLDPATIEVTGVSSRVEALAEARVTVFMDNPQQDMVVTRRPIFYDQQGNIASVNALNVGAEEVVITVPVDQLAGFTAKPIIVNWQGEVAQGYRLVDVRVEPDSVLLTGSPAQLDRFTRVQTEPIDISGLRESRTMQVSLDLPPGIELDEVQPVYVEIEIEPILTSSVIRKTPEIRALEEGLTLTLDADEVRVFVYGPLDKLDSLSEEDVRVTLDLFGLGIGQHSVEPDADVFVADVEVRSIQPPLLTVNLTRTLTETETLTGTNGTPVPTATPRSSRSGGGAGLSLLLAFLGMPAVIIPASVLTWRRERSKA
ncbi:MAG: CdaR family protein [Anaerolineae bacterium]|nr:CdaR family protein [Anaerolineae bacterium]